MAVTQETHDELKKEFDHLSNSYNALSNENAALDRLLAQADDRIAALEAEISELREGPARRAMERRVRARFAPAAGERRAAP